jgi:hypothetical protein
MVKHKSLTVKRKSLVAKCIIIPISSNIIKKLKNHSGDGVKRKNKKNNKKLGMKKKLRDLVNTPKNKKTKKKKKKKKKKDNGDDNGVISES